VDRSLAVAISRASSPPRREGGRIVFDVVLPPRGTWHACVQMVPRVESRNLRPVPACHSIVGSSGEYDVRRRMFLEEATSFASRESGTLGPRFVAALEQSGRDLAALRLYDCDAGPRAWTTSAGVPAYVAMFG